MVDIYYGGGEIPHLSRIMPRLGKFFGVTHHMYKVQRTYRNGQGTPLYDAKSLFETNSFPMHWTSSAESGQISFRSTGKSEGRKKTRSVPQASGLACNTEILEG
jgi:hypothetical protein